MGSGSRRLSIVDDGQCVETKNEDEPCMEDEECKSGTCFNDPDIGMVCKNMQCGPVSCPYCSTTQAACTQFPSCNWRGADCSQKCIPKKNIV
jgi:hypothetical protein